MSKETRNEDSFMWFLNIGYEGVSLQREESWVISICCGGGCSGKVGGVRESTWITVCTLDVSKSEANSL